MKKPSLAGTNAKNKGIFMDCLLIYIHGEVNHTHGYIWCKSHVNKADDLWSRSMGPSNGYFPKAMLNTKMGLYHAGVVSC